MKIISLSNQKGGVGKTTTCLALSAGLAGLKGKRVLAVDLDPQSNFTQASGVDLVTERKTIYHVFKGEADIRSVIVKTPLSYDLIPGGLALASADMEFVQLGRDMLLSRALSKISGYDYIICDTPPTLGILTANALMAPDQLIIPLNADIYSLQGLENLKGFVSNVHEYGNPRLKIAGLLITKYNSRQNLSRAMVDQIEVEAKKMGTKVFTAKIRESVAVREAALMQKDMFKESQNVNAIIDYGAFIEEFLEGIEE